MTLEGFAGVTLRWSGEGNRRGKDEDVCELLTEEWAEMAKVACDEMSRPGGNRAEQDRHVFFWKRNLSV